MAVGDAYVNRANIRGRVYDIDVYWEGHARMVGMRYYCETCDTETWRHGKYTFLFSVFLMKRRVI